jgi:hypothetical protein
MRKVCEVDGCRNLSASVGKQSGKEYFRKTCKSHWMKSSPRRHRIHKLRSIQQSRKMNLTLDEVEELLNSPCSICGWDKAHCDMHRIINGKDGGKYEKGNIVILCPNCHRIEHRC